MSYGYPPGAGPAAGSFGPVSPDHRRNLTLTRPHRIVVQGVYDSATSRLVATFPPVPSGRMWLVGHIRVRCSALVQAFHYVGGLDPDQHLRSGTPAGAMDDYDANQPIPIMEGEPSYIVWAGVTTGATGSARMEYWEVSA